jgi:hypothetical protein
MIVGEQAMGVQEHPSSPVVELVGRDPLVVEADDVRAAPATPFDDLSRNCATGSPEAARLVTLLRDNWRRLTVTEQHWVTGLLTQTGQGGPAPQEVRCETKTIRRAAAGSTL